MSRTTAGLLAILSIPVFNFLLYWLYKKTDVGAPFTFQQALRAFRAAKNWREQLFIAFHFFTKSSRKSFIATIVALDTVAFGVIATIFGPPKPAGVWHTIREVLLDAYDFFYKLRNPASLPLPPTPTPTP